MGGTQTRGDTLCKLRVFSGSDKVKLIWTKQHSPAFKRISFNVVREMIAYLEELQQPIIVLEDRIYAYQVTSNYCQLYILKEKIQANEFSYATYIDKETIFVCGGGALQCTSRCHIDAYILSIDGSVRKLQNMGAERKAHGVIYHGLTNAVYVFGGLTNKSEFHTGLQSCEKFLVEKQRWQSLPNMIEARSNFNPCLCSSVFYLCGGFTTSVETFNPMTNEFALVPNFILSESGYCTTVLKSDNLVVISRNYIKEWSLRRQSVTISRQHFESLVSPSNSSPVVYGQCVYVVSTSTKVCTVMCLESGVTEFSLTI